MSVLRLLPTLRCCPRQEWWADGFDFGLALELRERIVCAIDELAQSLSVRDADVREARSVDEAIRAANRRRGA